MKKHAFLLLITLVISNVLAYGGQVMIGKASYYGKRFHMRRTASGERFHMDSLTAAHRTLPFGTIVKVTNLKTKASVQVRINDRGPLSRKKIIDLSAGAAKKCGIFKTGIGMVRVEIVKSVKKQTRHRKPAEPKNEEAPVVQTKTKALEICAYVVQTGAFRDQDNAIHAREQLTNAGYADAAMEIIQTSAGQLYRVFLGPFKEPEEAERIRQALAQQQMEAYVIAVKEE